MTKKLISVENSTKTVKLQIDVENNKSEEETIKYNVNNNLLMDKLLIELGGLENDRSNRC